MKNLKINRIIAMVLCMALVGSLAVSGETKAADGDFVIKNGVLTAYNGNEKNVVIPDGVKKIGKNAFDSKDKVESVVIPKGCKEIGTRAFWFCTKLKKVTIPEGVKKIGEGAFKDTAIKKITIPKSVKTLGNKRGVFTYAERKQSIREITILNPKLKVKYMFGSGLDKAAYKKYKKEWTFGVQFLEKTVTIKGYKNSTAEKFVKDIKKNKKKYIQSLKFRALKK